MQEGCNWHELNRTIKQYKMNTGLSYSEEKDIEAMNLEDEHKQPCQEKVFVDTDSLKSLAIYLSGVKDGKGNLLPLGTIVLDDLWNAIKYLQGDIRFIAPRDKKNN